MDPEIVACCLRLRELIRVNFPEIHAEAEELAQQVADPRSCGADAVWEKLWSKPLYANVRVGVADRWKSKLTLYVAGAWQIWGEEIRFDHDGPRTFSPVTEAAKVVRENTGIALSRLFAIQGASRALRARAEAATAPFADLAAMDIGDAVSTVRHNMGLGWGAVTALHFLTDLGLACKPDTHLVRTVRYIGLIPDLPIRAVPTAAQAVTINRRVRELVEAVFGSFTPQTLRYMDKVLMEISRQGLIMDADNRDAA